MTLPGVGEKTADSIIGGRPYTKTGDLLGVAGVGPATLKRIKPFIRIGAGERRAAAAPAEPAGQSDD